MVEQAEQGPVRALRLTLRLDAHNATELANELRSIADRVELGDLNGNGLSAAPSASYVYELLSDPRMTPTKYFTALNDYLDGLKAKRAKALDSGHNGS